jgi:hypothetical protein
MDERAKAATDETRTLPDDAIRERIVRLAFGGDERRFEVFVGALREAFPPDVTVVLRGSAVVGVRWEDGAPFDADGPCTSDIDLTLVGGDMLKLWSDDGFYIPKLHTAPLNDETPHICPSLVPLRRALCRISGRAVNIQATSSLVQYARDVLFDQPYFTLIKAEDREGAGEEERNEEGSDERAEQRARERRDVVERDAAPGGAPP